MKPVDTAPFYAVKRVYQVSAICDGLEINEEGQVLDTDGNPMEGLYAAGNCSGGFYGDVTYQHPDKRPGGLLFYFPNIPSASMVLPYRN